jgi:SAM-dependent methyltransferase
MIHKLTPRWPAPLRPLLHWADRSYRRVRRDYTGLWDRRAIAASGVDMLPPAHLRDRVHGVPDIERFLAAGRRSKQRLERVLLEAGRPLASFPRILDFGCGCGRTLRWLEPLRETCELHGTDVDREAIAWCAAQIPFARFAVNQALPPLDYPDRSFDLVYGVSVLTHLDEPAQLRWLAELRRVARPEGLVLLSVHGDGARDVLDAEQLAQLDARGFLFVRTNRWKGIHPDWYQVAFHTPRYVRRRFGAFFEVVRYLPEGLTRQQDFVLLRRPASD